MKRFVKRYFQCLGTLILSMAVYHATVVPGIEPPPRPQTKPPEDDGQFATQRWWEQLFEQEAWQCQNPTIVQNQRGVLLASSWEQIGDKSWKLKPLSIILPQVRRSDDETPSSTGAELTDFSDFWVINAEQGATIHFDQPLDLRSGIVPSVQRGLLEGKIEITRRSLKQQSDSDWNLQTSDLSIDHRRISTQQDVIIRWKDSIIRGHDLRIMLRGDVLGGGHTVDRATTPWGPLDELELYHLDQLQLALPAGGIWRGFQSSTLNTSHDVSQLEARLDASCDGRLAFDFNDSVATLTNGVHIQHRLEGLPPDEFLCHKVSVKVEPDQLLASRKPSGQAPDKNNDFSLGGMRIRELIAVGIDSLQDFVGEKWVEIDAPTLGAAVRSKRLQVDFDRQRIELAGRLDREGATQSIAWLQYQGYEFNCPKLEYQAGPEDEQGNATHLGWMFASGPGELSATEATEIGASQIRWQKSLKMAPAKSPDEQWIELDGNTFVENQQQGFMTTDRLQVWLKRHPDPVTDGHGGSASLNAAENSTEARYLPDRLLATGPTQLTTPAMRIDVELLKLAMKFIQPHAERSSTPQGLMLSDSSGAPMYQFLSRPQPGAGGSNHSASPAEQHEANHASDSAELDNSASSTSPISIVGRSLDASVVSDGEQTWAERLTINGPVSIEELEPTVDEEHWDVSGDAVHLATTPDGQVDLQVDGKPARIHLGSGHLEGPSIRFDQNNNLIWMDQPGEFTLPGASMSNTDQGDTEWVKPLHCSWSGRLLFDGSKATIKGDIEFDGLLRQPERLWWLQGYCDQLHITLAQRIDLKNMESPKGQPRETSMQNIELRSNVDIRVAQTDLRGNRQSLQRLVVPTLRFDVPQQRIVGSGLGSVHAKFLSGTTSGLLVEGDSESKSGLRGAHLNFRDSMVYFMDRQEVVFEGKVEVASGPLRDWTDVIDLNSMRQLGPDQVILNCDQLKAYDTSQLSSTTGFVTHDSLASQAWEMQATGNVVFEGQTGTATFLGNGYQVTYASLKDRLMLRGDGRNPAYVQRTPLDPGRESTFKAYVKSAAINVRTSGIEDLKFSQFRMDLPNEDKGDGKPLASPPEVPSHNDALNPRGSVSRFFDSGSR